MSNLRDIDCRSSYTTLVNYNRVIHLGYLEVCGTQSEIIAAKIKHDIQYIESSELMGHLYV